MTQYLTRDVPRLTISNADLAARIRARLSPQPAQPPRAGRRLRVRPYLTAADWRRAQEQRSQASELRIRAVWLSSVFPPGSSVRVVQTAPGQITITLEE